MKNAMQLKAVIKKNCKRKTYIGPACNTKFHAGEVAGTNIYLKISTEFYFERWIFNCCNGGA